MQCNGYQAQQHLTQQFDTESEDWECYAKHLEQYSVGEKRDDPREKESTFTQQLWCSIIYTHLQLGGTGGANLEQFLRSWWTDITTPKCPSWSATSKLQTLDKYQHVAKVSQ